MVFKISITFSKNNTHVNLGNFEGKTLFKISAKQKNKKRTKVVGLQHLISSVILYSKQHDIKRFIVFVKGFNAHRFYTLKELAMTDFNIEKIFYVSSKPFNGCRQKKARRLLFFFLL